MLDEITPASVRVGHFDDAKSAHTLKQYSHSRTQSCHQIHTAVVTGQNKAISVWIENLPFRAFFLTDVATSG